MGGGKDGFLTPKAIANRIKAKGLQKLRWFCQMCEKQCRDENGFKCHCTSESHLRMMALFASKPGQFLDEFSRKFEEGFMDILSRRFRSKRVHSNIVYNEYIADKMHTHMNATKWTTLAEFVWHLAKEGKVEVEETPKGLFIQYIDRDPAALERLEREKKKERAEEDDEERQRAFIQQQIEATRAAAAAAGPAPDPVAVPAPLPAVGGGVTFALAKRPAPPAATTATAPTAADAAEVPPAADAATASTASTAESAPSEPATPAARPAAATTGAAAVPSAKLAAVFELGAGGGGGGGARVGGSAVGQKRTSDGAAADQRVRSTLAAIREEEQMRGSKRPAPALQPNWITEGIVVKVLNKKVGGGRFAGQKGVIQKVEQQFLATVRLLESGAVLKIDQEDLQTVLPALGGKVLIVNGADRGSTATLVQVLTDQFCAEVRLPSGRVARYPYEHICKLERQE